MARAKADRLNKLKEQIAAGLYMPDSRAVAEKMLKRWYRLHETAATGITADDALEQAAPPGCTPPVKADPE